MYPSKSYDFRNICYPIHIFQGGHFHNKCHILTHGVELLKIQSTPYDNYHREDASFLQVFDMLV